MSMPAVLTGLESGGTPPTLSPLDVKDENVVSLAKSAALPHSKPLKSFYLNQMPVRSERVAAMPRYWNFTVQLNMELEPHELVALTGNTEALGEWQLERAVPLRPYGHMQWFANVPLQSCHNISYRYFTYVLDAHGSRLVRRWETELQPRTLLPCNSSDNNSAPRVDRFGEIEKGAVLLQRGWLTNESIVQLKFERERMFEVLQRDRFSEEELLVQLVPLQEGQSSDEHHDAKGLCIEVCKLHYGESHLQKQPQQGVLYKPGDVVLFHLTVPRALKYAYALHFYTPQQQQSEQQLIGRALITATQLQGSEGVLELAVMSPAAEDGSAQPLALLTLPYLVVQPLEQAVLDFHTTYAQYWPKSWPNLDVAHRGMGRSYIEGAPEQRENTIASFLRAYELHSDMVELDVQLTADGVPIIWHDFAVQTAPPGHPVSTPRALQQRLIKDLSYAQLKQLRVFAVVNNTPQEYPSHNSEPRIEHRLFPRLVDVLQALPLSLGIDVEIKWPQRTACGGVESAQTQDKNWYVDRILQTVLQHGCGRPLVFSSFDADICTMLRFKQNLLPVMFLTQGCTQKWPPLLDLRTRNFEQAVNFAQAFELVGTAPHAEDFVGAEGAQLMQLAHNLDQIAVVWGDDCNSRERVQYFGALGAAGICYDRPDLYLAQEKKSSFFSTIRTEQLFEAQCKY